MPRLILLLLVVITCSCGTHYQKTTEPTPITRYTPYPDHPPFEVALVLGGGGARGMAHLAVIEEFEKAGIPIDLVVGCSAGSIVGALYCDNPDVKAVHKGLCSFDRDEILDYSIFDLRYGLVHGDGLRRTLQKHLQAKTFDHLCIPLVVVATDLLSGELVEFGTGDLARAVHASAAVPFYFKPVEYQGRVLVDGGVIDNIPVRTARAYNPKVVIAVDISAPLSNEFPKHMFGVAMRSMEINFRTQGHRSLEAADLVIRPKVDEIGIFDENAKVLAYEAGREAAREAIPKILELIESRR